MQDPNDIFRRFSENTRRILVSSQKIAETSKSGIGSEHILLSLTINSGNLAHDILKENLINIDQIRLIIRFNNIRSIHGQGLSIEAKKILESAIQKAIDLKHNLVEPEHLLWAIINNRDCIAYKILVRIGADTESIKDQINEIMDSSEEFEELIDNIEHIEKNMGFSGPQKDFLFFNAAQNQPANRVKSKNPNSKTPTLDYFGIDLTDRAKKNLLDPVIGRENEITRMMQVLTRRTKNNPVLVGDPGVGKTAIVEGLAQKIILGNVPLSLQNKRLVSLDLALIVSGTMYRGQFEERIKSIINEISKSKDTILFLDEIHTLIGTGSAEGSMDLANILKPALAKGNLSLIGATTTEEYRKNIEKDAALERRLQPIKVSEPSIEETIRIIKGVKSRYEQHHNLKISNEAIIEAVELSNRYISDRFLPDKAIDLIDEASSALQISAQAKNSNKDLVILKRQLNKILEAKDTSASKQNYEDAAKLKTQEIKLKLKIQKIENGLNRNETKKIVEPNDIANIVSIWTGIPVASLFSKEKIKILNIDKILKEHIIGQDEAINTISEAIRRSKAGISDPNRPMGAFVFLGPTGVGKTELAKVLAREVFGSEKSLVKIDMSEFMEKHNLSRLVGAPPGYIGYDDSGKLTESVRKNPYSLILLDEIEKAHPEIFNILLQILEDGYLTDAKGRRVNFRNTIIIMTSNIGMHELTQTASLGFKIKSPNDKIASDKKYNEMKEKVINQLKSIFKPELINRIDKTIVFKPLDKTIVSKIVLLNIKELANRLAKEGYELEVSNDVIDVLVKKGFSPEYGARPLRRLITELIENPLATKILNETILSGDKILVKLQNNQINFIKI